MIPNILPNPLVDFKSDPRRFGKDYRAELAMDAHYTSMIPNILPNPLVDFKSDPRRFGKDYRAELAMDAHYTSMIPNIQPNPPIVSYSGQLATNFDFKVASREELLAFFENPPGTQYPADVHAAKILQYVKARNEPPEELVANEAVQALESVVRTVIEAKAPHEGTPKAVHDTRSSASREEQILAGRAVTSKVWEPGPNTERSMDEDDKAIAALLPSTNESDVTTPVIDQVTQTDTYIQDIKYQLAKFTSRMLRALNSQAPLSE